MGRTAVFSSTTPLVENIVMCAQNMPLGFILEQMVRWIRLLGGTIVSWKPIYQKLLRKKKIYFIRIHANTDLCFHFFTPSAWHFSTMLLSPLFCETALVTEPEPYDAASSFVDPQQAHPCKSIIFPGITFRLRNMCLSRCNGLTILSCFHFNANISQLDMF